jgi:hypothetical protein
MDTTGKTVTLEKGVIVTDVGAAVVNGHVDPIIRKCVADDGEIHVIIARVIRETPKTLRRDSLPKWIY